MTRSIKISVVAAAIAFTLAGAGFEVATVRPAVHDPNDNSSGEDGGNGILKVYNVSLRRCIRYAYGLPESQILGGPSWMDELTFDINAKADYPATEPELLEMLRPLLAERFRLQVHRETRPMSGYSLLVAKGGLKANVSPEGGRSGSNGGRGRIDAVGTPLSNLVVRLTEILGRPVIDRTGETRRLDYRLRWTPDGVEPTLGDAPSLFTAIEEQMGLRLQAERIEAEVIIVDRAELPTEN